MGSCSLRNVDGLANLAFGLSKSPRRKLSQVQRSKDSFLSHVRFRLRIKSVKYGKTLTVCCLLVHACRAFKICRTPTLVNHSLFSKIKTSSAHTMMELCAMAACVLFTAFSCSICTALAAPQQRTYSSNVRCRCRGFRESSCNNFFVVRQPFPEV